MSTTKRHPARMARLGCDGAAGSPPSSSTRFRHRRLCELGPDGGEPRPVHATGPYRCRMSCSGARGPHPQPGLRRLPRLRRAPGRDRARGADDRLADAAGIDRLEFRRLNALRDGDPTAPARGSRERRPARDASKPSGRLAPPPAAARPAQRRASAGPPPRRRHRLHAGTAAATPASPTPRRSASASDPDGTLVILYNGAHRHRPGLQHHRDADRRRRLGLPVAAFTRHGRHPLHPRRRQDLGSRQTFVSGKAAEPRRACAEARSSRRHDGEPTRTRLALDGGRSSVGGARRSTSRTGGCPPTRRRRLRRRGPLRPADHAARRRRPGHSLRRLRLRGAARRARRRHELGTVQGAADHRRPRRRPGDQPDPGRRPDRGRHRPGHRHGADGGVRARAHREPARLPDPDHRRRAGDRIHPRRGPRPRAPSAPRASASRR